MEREKAILVGVSVDSKKEEDSLKSIRELAALASTAKIEVVDKFIQVKHNVHPKYFLGKGKLRELGEYITSEQVEIVIFNDDLSPLQHRNVESILDCKVIGRTELILDIFATRARTKEAKLQVEYAQLSYLFPRLTRRWAHLSRIEGGIGFRGPGETQLEMDRRAIKKRLYTIKKQLDKISVQHSTRRKLRKRKNIVCLVGYTNAGKSSLLNSLSKRQVFIDDALFATLDSLVRQVYISSNLSILLIDTIGFIKKLPHHLITSFKSTLEEVKSAQLLLHVIDVTEEDPLDHIDSVNLVLHELDSLNIQTIYVFNKIDNLTERGLPEKVSSLYENSCFISAKTGEGLQRLKILIEENLLNCSG